MRWQPAMDYDVDGCYPTPAVGPGGTLNPGLRNSGALNGQCHDASDLDNANMYARSRCDADGLCGFGWGAMDPTARDRLTATDWGSGFYAPGMTDAELAFALACALHAGFQLSVTTVVYPALTEVRAADWEVAHARHSRRIAPVVAVVYAALAGSAAWLLLSTTPDEWWWVALGTGAGAVLVTATLAAPTHGRLDTPEPRLLQRLVRVDRARCVLATGGLLAALVAAYR
ncbi:MAG: NPP1 family protein [Nocardioides sp.]